MPEPRPDFHFGELAPDPRLTPWLARYWEFSVHGDSPATHHVPPDGGTSLLVATGPGRPPMLLASGPWIVPLAVQVGPGDRFWGVRLQPGAAQSFLGTPPAGFFNSTRPLQTLFGRTTAELVSALQHCETLADAAAVMNESFLAETRTMAAPDSLVAEVVAIVVRSRGTVRMSAVAERLGVSPRTLLRRFRTATGISPKQFARVVRFRFAALDLVTSDAKVGEVAAAAGYADQPHLTREWTELLGLTPRRGAEVMKMTSHDNVTV